MRDELIEEMKAVFGDDQKRISHAMAVLAEADIINAKIGANERIVTAAAILHDIGIKEAEKKWGSNAGRYQEMEGPTIADEILRRRGFSGEEIEHICRIIANHHSDKDIDTNELKVIWDADWLINFEDIYGDVGGEEKKKLIEKIFKTQEGKRLANEYF